MSARAELLAHQLGEARERIRALEAPAVSTAVSTTVDADDPPMEPPPTPELLTPHPNGQASAPWWRKWSFWALL